MIWQIVSKRRNDESNENDCICQIKKTSPKIRIIRKLISTNVPILSSALVSQVLIIMKYVQLRLL